MIVYDRDFARVWYDGTTPCVFSSVVRIPDADQANELLDRQLSLIRELRQRYGCVFSICNLQYCKNIDPFVVDIYAERLKEQFHAGLLHKAFVKPANPAAARVVEGAAIRVTHLSVSLHSTIEDAFSEMNRRRIRRNSRLLKSVFGFLDRG